MVSAFHCPVSCVMLSFCPGDNSLSATLSLVIMARAKLCRNSWSQPPLYSIKVKLWRRRNRNWPLEENNHNSKVEHSCQDFVPRLAFYFASLIYVFAFITSPPDKRDFLLSNFPAHSSLNICVSCVITVLWSFRWATVISFMPASVMEDIWLRTESKTVLYNAGPGST